MRKLKTNIPAREVTYISVRKFCSPEAFEFIQQYIFKLLNNNLTLYMRNLTTKRIF